MQPGGQQYGLSEMQQFVLGRTAPRLYGHTQDLPAAPSPLLRMVQQLQQQQQQQQHQQHQQQQQQQHHNHHAQHQQQQQQQQQVQQHHHLAQHHVQHAQFQPHPQLLTQSLNLSHQHQRNQAPNQHHVQLLVAGANSPDMASPPLHTPLLLPTISNARPTVITDRDASIDDDGAAEEGEKGVGSNRWPIEETMSLLRIRSEMDAIFRDSAVKGHLWEEVSRRLGELGYHRSSRKCKEKFENVNKYYKKTKDSKCGRQDGKSYRFFTELEALYSSTANNTNLNCDSTTPDTLAKACMTQGYGGAGNHEALTATIAAAIATSSGLNRSCGSSSQSDDDEDDENDDDEENDNDNGDDDDDDDDENDGNDNDDEEGVDGQADDEDDNGGEGYGDGGVEKGDEQEMRKTRKRKRRSWGGMKRFLERLVKRVTEQQEALHKKFLETIERLDEERVMREEAYRRQEVARLNREHELRTQEHAMAAARDAALVAFLQKVTGHSLTLPPMPPPPPPPPPPALPPSIALEVEQDKDLSDFNTKRWPKVEVHALIRLRSGMEPRFQEAGPKAQLWEEISATMAQMGYGRSAKRCKEKWENINKYFRKTKDSCKRRPDNAKTCPYFHYLDTLYQKGILSSPTTTTKCSVRGEGQSDNLLEYSREDGDQMQEDGRGCAGMIAIVVTSADSTNPGVAAAMEAAAVDHGGAAHHLANLVSPPHSHSLIVEASDTQALSFGGLESVSKKVKMEGFVKEILDLQQQQHQKLIEEYERMEHAREMRDHERRRQEMHALQQQQQQGGQQSNPRDNAALMAVLHKLAGDPSEFRMVESSSTG